MIITFTCPFCETVHTGTVDMTGEMPTGILPQCDCKEFREDWERKHRAEIEQRKQRRRNTPLTQVGREPRSRKRR